MKQLLPALLLVVLGNLNVTAGLVTINAPGDGNTANRDHFKTFVWRINLTGLIVPINLEESGMTQVPEDTHTWKRMSKILRLEKLALKTSASSGDAVIGASDFKYTSDRFSVPENTAGKHIGHELPSMKGPRGDTGGGNSENNPELSIGIHGNRPDFGFGCGVGPEMNIKTELVPEPSIWKLFVLSLLWIPFNRWERKEPPAGSGGNDNSES